MRDYAKQPQPVSRTIASNPKAANQASISEILQRYKKSIIQPAGLKDEDELLQGKFSDNPIQQTSIEEEEPLQPKFENKTGLPDDLKAGIENISGYSMDDVKVHYNSDKPAQLNALAYAQGSSIHVAPGQEKHLPHEAWHVVQQKKGKVRPTTQYKGINISNNEKLEKEADSMGIKCLNYSSNEIEGNFTNEHSLIRSSNVIQLFGNSFLQSIKQEDYAQKTQEDREDIIYFMDYIKFAYDEAHKNIIKYYPTDNSLLKETSNGILFLEIFNKNLQSRFGEFEYDKNENFTTLIQPFINEVSNLPEKLIFATDDGKGTMADLFEILALNAHIDDEKLMRYAERGGSADFKIRDDYYDPFMTPIKLRSSAVTTWNKFFKNRGNTFDQHAGGKGCNAKAILDLTFTPYYDLILLKDSFKKDMETTETDEILQLANVYVVYYGNSFLTQESIVLMDELKLMFDHFRAKNQSVVEAEAEAEAEEVGLFDGLSF